MREIVLEFGSGSRTNVTRIVINPRSLILRTAASLRRRFNKQTEFTLFARPSDNLYAHLVRQEVDIYAKFPESMTQEDFDALCSRRGFWVEEAQSILDALYFLGYRFSVTVNQESCKSKS